MRVRAAVLLAALAAAPAALAGEPTVLVEDPLRAEPGEDAQLVTAETLAWRAHRELLARVPVPEDQRIGGPAMVGISTVPASRIRRGDAPQEVLDRLKGWDGWGAAVVRVLPGSPAEAAWLQAGDVVVRFSGLWVDRDDTLTWLASRAEPDRETELWYWREGQVYRTWISPGVRDVVQAEGNGSDKPLEGIELKLGRQGLVPPVLLEEVEVEYPSTARRLEAGGAGVFGVVVGVEGDVIQAAVKVSTGHEELDEAALEAIRQRVYEPGRFRGRRVGVSFDLVVTFWPEGPPEVEDQSVESGAKG